jgi:hypothetical protein
LMKLNELKKLLGKWGASLGLSWFYWDPGLKTDLET